MTAESQSYLNADEAHSQPLDGAITSVAAGFVDGWLSGMPPKRHVALFAGRRRIASAEPRSTRDATRVEFTFDARDVPADLLAAPELYLDVTLLGDPSTRFASRVLASGDFLKVSDRPRFPTKSLLEGCIDGAANGILRGWAWDTARPERQLDLFVFKADRYIGKHRAIMSRPDLAATGRGHGSYGFEIPVAEVATTPFPFTVLAGAEEYWRVPLGKHALSSKVSRPCLRDLPKTLEGFARDMTAAEPFPKKAYVIDKIKRGALPDPFAADYVYLALECLRHEMVATTEAMTGDWRQRLRKWMHLRAVGWRIRRLEELAKTIIQGQHLLKRAGGERQPDGG